MPTESPNRLQGLVRGDVIDVRVTAEEKPKYYEVRAAKPFFYPYIYASLAAGAEVKNQSLDKLNPPVTEILQVNEIEIFANVIAKIRQLQTDAFGLAKQTSYYLDDRTNMAGNTTFLPIWIDKDRQPDISLKNNTPITITNLKVLFKGWRYQIAPLKQKPVTASKVTIGSF